MQPWQSHWPPPSALSPTERKVLTLVAAGLEDKEIAAALGMSHATVKTHVINLRVKLGAVNRTHAAALGLSKGLIHPINTSASHGGAKLGG